MARVLVVDDARPAREYLELLLAEEGHRSEGAADGVEALLALEAARFDLVIADLRMPRMDGLELIPRVKHRWPELPMIVVTADADVSAVIEAVKLYAAENEMPMAIAQGLLIGAIMVLSAYPQVLLKPLDVLVTGQFNAGAPPDLEENFDCTLIERSALGASLL